MADDVERAWRTVDDKTRVYYVPNDGNEVVDLTEFIRDDGITFNPPGEDDEAWPNTITIRFEDPGYVPWYGRIKRRIRLRYYRIMDWLGLL